MLSQCFLAQDVINERDRARTSSRAVPLVVLDIVVALIGFGPALQFDFQVWESCPPGVDGFIPELLLDP